MNKEQEEMLVTTASAAGRTLASALKGVAETALKLMWSRSGGRHDTVLTHLKNRIYIFIFMLPFDIKMIIVLKKIS
jgi:hypothetical protein